MLWGGSVPWNGSRDPLSTSSMAFLLYLLLLSLSAFQATPPPSLFQPQPSVVNRQRNPQILCQVLNSPAEAHVLSWYQQLPGKGPTFLLSQREGAATSYGPGVTPRFLAELDPEKNSARLTVGNAGPEDVGIYYCAIWSAGHYIFGEGTRFLYEENLPLVLLPPQLSLLTSGPGSPILCVALGHHPAPLRLSWTLEGQLQKGGAVENLIEMGVGVVSALHLSREDLGGTVLCRADHESGTSVATLRLLPAKKWDCPDSWDEGEAWNGDQQHDRNALAQLQWTLTVSLYCYVGVLGGAKLYTLFLFGLLAVRQCRRPKGGPSFQSPLS